MRAILFLAALVLCIFIGGGESFAATGPKEPPHAPGTSVEMPYLIAPLTIDGKLVSYAYISSRIIASTPSTAIDIRGMTPFIQDSYVRDVNGQSIGDNSDPPVVDPKALVNRLLGDARRVIGASKINSVEIIQIQFSALRPSPRR
jgi:hypothetical protein